MRWPRYLALAAARPLLFALYFFSGLLPRRRGLWVFGSWGGHRFADNAASFFLYCQGEIGDEVDLVWISRRSTIITELRHKGYRAYWIWSPRGMACCLRAGVFLFDCFIKDINYWLSRNAVAIALWSGIPIKKIERDIDNPRSRYYQLFHGPLPVRILLGIMMPWHLKRADLYICTSEMTQRIVQSCFGVGREKTAITGLPRNDVFFEDLASAPDLLRRLPSHVRSALSGDQRVFVYLPTFRDSGHSYMGVDWEVLETFLAKHNAVFIYKTHPQEAADPSMARYPHIHVLEQDVGIENLMNDSDVLISDYSSIIFDYLLTDKPIIYYIPDIDDFTKGSRSFYFDYDELVAGPKARTFEELLTAMAHTINDGEDTATASERRKQIAQRLHKHFDGGACARVLAEVLSRVPALTPVPAGSEVERAAKRKTQ